MANILFITSLYPEKIDQSRQEKTFALHNFVKHWCDDNVIVIKPIRIGRKEFTRYSEIKRNQVGNITVFSMTYVEEYFNKPILSGIFLGKIIKTLSKTNFSPNLLITHYRASHALCSPLTKKYNIPQVCGIHITDILTMKKETAIGNAIFQSIVNAQGVACRSDRVKDKLSEYILSRSIDRELFVAHSGIEEKNILPLEDLKRRINKHNKLSLVTVSTLKERKNIRDNLKAYKLLEDQFASYAIIGGGDQLRELKEICDDLDFNNPPYFYGQINPDAVLGELEDKDVFLLVSSRETFGLAYLEAMSRGCIVIGLKGEGIDGIIVDGVNGFLCKDHSPEEISRVLRNVISLSHEERESILLKCWETLNHYTEEKSSLRYRSYLESFM